MSSFSDRLKELRDSRELSQLDLARKIGVSQRAVSYYELGKNIPTLDVLIRIADFFDVTLDYLVGRRDKE